MRDVWQQIVASGSGALITALFMTPLDVVKIRLQAQSKGFVKGDCFLYCNGLMDHVCTCLNGGGPRTAIWKKLSNAHLNGTLDALIKIPKVEGLRSLWSGLPPTLIMAVPNTVIYFTTYDQLKLRFGYGDNGQSPWYIPLFCGSVARAGAVTVITPLELVRTKMQSESMTYRQISLAVNASLNSGGVLSLWRGWGPLIWRDVPFSGLYFLIYEYLKKITLRTSKKDHLTTIQSFSYGAVGGVLAGFVTLPFDVVKTHRQIELGAKNMTSGSSPATFQILKQLYHKRGISSWFTGIGPRILKVSPACAIMISSYEYCKRFFKLKSDEGGSFNVAQ